MENLKIAAYLRQRFEKKEMIEHIFALFPTLSNLKERKAGFLSGGEQQMLSIGMALIVKPVLLLLDEPLLGLSPHMQVILVAAIRDLREKAGKTILITEQFARPILPILERGYVIENGMLSMTGTGKELMDNPEIRVAYFGV
jgi:branched-chain amino acid transport system ATP-binding protein